MTVTDVLEFIADQRHPRRVGNVVRLDDGEPACQRGRSGGGYRACQGLTPACPPGVSFMRARCRRGRCRAARRTGRGAAGSR